MALLLAGLWEMSCVDGWYFIDPEVSMELSRAFLAASRAAPPALTGIPSWRLSFRGSHYTISLLTRTEDANRLRHVYATQTNEETGKERRLRLELLAGSLQVFWLELCPPPSNPMYKRFNFDDERRLEAEYQQEAEGSEIAVVEKRLPLGRFAVLLMESEQAEDSSAPNFARYRARRRQRALCRVELRCLMDALLVSIRREDGPQIGEVSAAFCQLPTVLSSFDGEGGLIRFVPRKISLDWAMKILDASLVPVAGGDAPKREEVCAICLNPLLPGDGRVVRLPNCTHWFHREEVLRHARIALAQSGESSSSYNCCLCKASAVSLSNPSPAAVMRWRVVNRDDSARIATTYDAPAGVDPELGRYDCYAKQTLLPLSTHGVMTHILMQRAFKKVRRLLSPDHFDTDHFDTDTDHFNTSSSLQGLVLALVGNGDSASVRWNGIETDETLGDEHLFERVLTRCLRLGVRPRKSDQTDAGNAVKYFTTSLA